MLYTRDRDTAVSFLFSYERPHKRKFQVYHSYSAELGLLRQVQSCYNSKRYLPHGVLPQILAADTEQRQREKGRKGGGGLVPPSASWARLGLRVVISSKREILVLDELHHQEKEEEEEEHGSRRRSSSLPFPTRK